MFLEKGRQPESKVVVVRDGKTERIQNAGSEFESIPGVTSTDWKWRQKAEGLWRVSMENEVTTCEELLLLTWELQSLGKEVQFLIYSQLEKFYCLSDHFSDVLIAT